MKVNALEAIDGTSRFADHDGMASKRDDDLQRALGARVRALRQSKGLTLEQVAARIDAPVSVLGRIEGGRRGVSVPTLFALARAMGCHASQLVDLGGPEIAPGDPAPTEGEAELLGAWRVAPPEIQGALLALLKAAVKA